MSVKLMISSIKNNYTFFRRPLPIMDKPHDTYTPTYD